MAELADAADSKSVAREGVWVRAPPSAPPAEPPIAAGGRLCRPGGHTPPTHAAPRKEGPAGEPRVPPRIAADSKSVAREGVWVRAPPSAPPVNHRSRPEAGFAGREATPRPPMPPPGRRGPAGEPRVPPRIAADSKSVARKGVWVRAPPSASQRSRPLGMTCGDADRDPDRRRGRARAQSVHQGRREQGRARRPRGGRSPSRLGGAAAPRPRRPLVRGRVVPAADPVQRPHDRPHGWDVPAHVAHQPEPGSRRRGAGPPRLAGEPARGRSTSRSTRCGWSRRSGSTC